MYVLSNGMGSGDVKSEAWTHIERTRSLLHQIQLRFVYNLPPTSPQEPQIFSQVIDAPPSYAGVPVAPT